MVLSGNTYLLLLKVLMISGEVVCIKYKDHWALWKNTDDLISFGSVPLHKVLSRANIADEAV